MKRIIGNLGLWLFSTWCAMGLTFTTLTAFRGTNGAQPEGSLGLGTNGYFYGATRTGGAYSNGTVFVATPSGAVTTLASFDGANGAQPFAALAQGSDGNFYGTASAGGAHGQGTVYSMTPSGTLAALVSFDGTNGAQPYGPVVQGPDRNLYGTASTGGAYGLGTVFMVNLPGGTLNNLFSFNGTNGAQPFCGLTIAGVSNFVLYGTTSAGGSFNSGTLFSLRLGTNSVFTTLYSFTGAADGAGPQAGLLQASDGNFYGTTAGGGTNGVGTVFQLKLGFVSSSTLTTLHSFDTTNGAIPFAALVQASDTNFYGTTFSGGANNFGTLFSIAADGTFTSLNSFPGGNDGAEPYFAGLTQGADGNLYGATSAGGKQNDGTLYQVSGFVPLVITAPANQTLVRGATATFTVSAAGSAPLAYQWQVNSSNLKDNGRISGSMTPTLTISNLTTADAGSYTVMVQNGAGSLSSPAATLAVVNPPVVSMSNLRQNSVLKSPLLNVSGTTSDNVPVQRVLYQLNGAGWQLATPASGWSKWTANNLGLQPDTNVLQAYAVNVVGILSPTNTVSFIYSPGVTQLVVQAVGPGAVSPNYNTQKLDIFRPYSMASRPRDGYVLANWIGTTSNGLAFSNDSPVLNFVMLSNLVIQANFVPSPFTNVSGSYNGLFYETNGVAAQSSGFFNLAVTRGGTMSGSLLSGAARYPISGWFHLDGAAQLTAAPRSAIPLTVALQLDLTTNQSDRITGTISSPAWTAELAGDRALFDARTNVPPEAGQYTMVVAGAIATGGSPATEPGGDGYATVTVSKTGRASLNGSLADGTKISQSAPLSKYGQWPFYEALYGGRGMALSWITNGEVQVQSNGLTANLGGAFAWIKPPLPNPKFYTNGFTLLSDVVGSRYTPPGAGTNVLDLTNMIAAQAVLNGGNLAGSITNEISIAANNRVTNLSSNRFTLGFSLSSGFFQGGVLDTNSAKTISFSGVVLQGQQQARGYFLGTNQSGQVLISR